MLWWLHQTNSFLLWRPPPTTCFFFLYFYRISYIWATVCCCFTSASRTASMQKSSTFPPSSVWAQSILQLLRTTGCSVQARWSLMRSSPLLLCMILGRRRSLSCGAVAGTALFRGPATRKNLLRPASHWRISEVTSFSWVFAVAAPTETVPHRSSTCPTTNSTHISSTMITDRTPITASTLVSTQSIPQNSRCSCSRFGSVSKNWA